MVNDMTIEELLATPELDWQADAGEFDSLIVIPTEELHDSGYRCMYFIACVGNSPKWKLGGGSDVIHLDGIGGYGKNWFSKGEGVPRKVNVSGWSIDCLPNTGLLRFFAGVLSCGHGLSSFELFSESKVRVTTNQ